MARYRNYSDDDKATALAFYDACNNLTMVARECKIPLTTVKLWVDNRNTMESAPSAESVAKKKIDLAAAFEELAEKCVLHAIKNADNESAYHATGMAEKAVQTMRLLRDQATTITGQVDFKSQEEADAKAAEIIEAGLQRLRIVNGNG